MRGKIVIGVGVAAGFLCLSYFWAYAQSARESIALGSVHLVLGMPQDVVMAAVTREYDLVNVGGTGYLWIVQSKHGTPFRTIGQLRFEDRRLIMVTRDWGPENQERGFELARRLYLALAELTKEGSATCQIELTHHEESSHDSKYIRLKCGEKFVAVNITAINKEGGYTPTGQRELAWVDEVLLVRELQDQR